MGKLPVAAPLLQPRAPGLQVANGRQATSMEKGLSSVVQGHWTPGLHPKEAITVAVAVVFRSRFSTLDTVRRRSHPICPKNATRS